MAHTEIKTEDTIKSCAVGPDGKLKSLRLGAMVL